jgi:hypothetical protein
MSIITRHFMPGYGYIVPIGTILGKKQKPHIAVWFLSFGNLENGILFRIFEKVFSSLHKLTSSYWENQGDVRNNVHNDQGISLPSGRDFFFADV